jgi:hypothetical protein
MIVGLALSFLISIITGVLLLRLVWPDTAAYAWRVALPLGAGLGTGISSVLLFVWLLAFGPTWGFPLAEVALLVILALATLRRGRTLPVMNQASRQISLPSPQYPLLRIAFPLTLTAAAAAFVSMLRQHPHGEWDAWMNWVFRARMIYRGGVDWEAAFSAALPWSHPDYPLLLPSLVVRSWLYAGTDTVLGPSLVAATFTFGTVALLAGAIAVLRTPTQGLLAGLVLLSTPFFIVHGTSLYADVPLGFFFLATLVCLALDARYEESGSRFAILAGTAAGLSMWTKNEGLLFTLAIVAGLLTAEITTKSRGSRRRMFAFAGGLAPLLLVAAVFKIGFAPSNDLLSTLSVDRTMARLTDVSRYYTTGLGYVQHITSFGSNGFGSAVWLLIAYLLGMGLNRAEIVRTWFRASIAALVLLLAGHFMVFVSMADELARLIASSLDRLILQIWPSALLIFFMGVRTLEEALSTPVILERQAETGSGALR